MSDTGTKNGSFFKDAALGLAHAGYKVHPLKPGTKKPASKNGSKDATDDTAQIEEWSAQYPSANIAYRTGAGPAGSGILVLDEDGPDGRESIAALVDKHGPLPETLTVKTGREDGGRQYIFRLPDGETVQGGSNVLGDGVDIRGEGNYCVAPPSLHPDTGLPYAWENDADIAEAPSWLLEAIRSAGRDGNGDNCSIPHAEGMVTKPGRNVALIRQGGFLRGKNYSADEINEALQDYNRRYCAPALDPAEVAAVARSAATYPENGFNLTDVGNAQRLVYRHGHNIRYCYLWKSWLVWDGKRWALDQSGAIYRLAKDAVRLIYEEASRAEDSETRKAISKHARGSESNNRIKAMIELAQSEKGIAVHPDNLDTDVYALNVNNGTLDLRTGELHEHRRHDLITRVVNVDYNAKADAPNFDRFLNRIMDGNQEVIRYLYQALGYGLTGDTSERALFIAWGDGSNGKSTLMERVLKLTGGAGGHENETYGMRMHPDTLMAAHKNSIPNDIARLAGKRFVLAQENEKGAALAESTVKEMTGNDTMTGRFMRQEFFDFPPTHKIFLSTNYRPKVSNDDQAMWDRLKLIPFTVRIPEAEKDKQLEHKLDAELPGILARIVRGAVDWYGNGLQEPEAVSAATTDYRAEMDPLADFLEDCCVVGDGYKVPGKDLWPEYQKWATQNTSDPLTKTEFQDHIRSRFGKVQSVQYNGKRTRCYIGLGVQLERPENPQVVTEDTQSTPADGF